VTTAIVAAIEKQGGATGEVTHNVQRVAVDTQDRQYRGYLDRSGETGAA
jgi:hypothetical protein